MRDNLLRSGVAACGLALAAPSCSHAVLVRPAPSYEAFAFEAPLPAAAAVFVDADQFFREVPLIRDASGDEHCGGSRYPVDAREPFEVSVIGTMERLVLEVEPTTTPLDRAAMEARGLDSVIVVRVDTFNDGLTSGGLLNLNFEAGAELIVSVSAFTHEGLQVRETVFGNGVQNQRGLSCDTGAAALGAAIEVAIENSMTELGELIVNSPELRRSLGAG